MTRSGISYRSYPALVLLVLLVGGTAALATGQAQQHPADQATHRAGLVVRYSDGTTATRCVAFASETISGRELLERSGLEIAIAEDNLGAFICAIGREGCPAERCLCQYPPDYWRYWLLDTATNAWRSSGVGASGRVLRDGAVDGWTWGETEALGIRPPPFTFAEICPTAEEPAFTGYLPLLRVPAAGDRPGQMTGD